MRSLWPVLLLALATARRKRGSLLALAFGAALFQFIVAASYPAIGGAAAVEGVVQTFPPGLRRLLRIAPNLQAGFGLQDYLALGYFHPVFLGFGAAFVVGRATDALAGQIERGSIYVLLSRPVARWMLVVSQAIEMICGAAVICAASWIGTALGAASLAEPVPLGGYALVAIAAWALFGALGAGAFIISSWGNQTARVVGLGTAWTLIAFLLDVLPAVARSPLAWLNPWHHYDPPTIVATGSLPGGVLVLAGWVIGGIALAVGLFERRDLA